MIGVIAFGSLVSATTAVFAYPGIPATAVVVSTTCAGGVPAGGTCTITVKFTSSEGLPIVGGSINWVVTVPPGGSITPNPSTTDANGNSTVTYQAPGATTGYVPGDAVLASVVDLAAVSNCAGRITGTSGGVSVSLPITVACTSGTGTLLPTASTGSPTDGFDARWALIAVALVGVLVAIGGGARIRRSRRLSA